MEHLYDNSPLNRKVGSYNAGTVFRTEDRKQTVTYDTNAENEVAYFTVTAQGLSFSGFHPPHTLFKTTETNEDGIAVAIYKDYGADHPRTYCRYVRQYYDVRYLLRL